MVKPVQVHLDAQDFSRFADNNPATNGIRKELFALVESKKIEIRYSFVTICEIAALAPKDYRFARKRANEVVNLTCGKCVYFGADIREKELDDFTRYGRVLRSPYSNCDYWYPDIVTRMLIEREAIAKQIRDKIAKSPNNRKEKRRLREKYLSTTRKPSQDARAIFGIDTAAVPKINEEIVPQDCNIIPSDMFAAFVFGEISQARLRKEVHRSLSNLSNLFCRS